MKVNVILNVYGLILLMLMLSWSKLVMIYFVYDCTKIDCQINLIMLANIEHVFFVLHIYCDKLIAYLWGMFTIVYLTKLFISDEMLYFRLFIQINSFAFNLLAPSIFIQTFSEKNHVRHNCFIINFIDSIAHPVKV